MNIFALHENPTIAAICQCDKHVVKMILESAQMLSTAHRVLEPAKEVIHDAAGLCRVTHKMHPCTIWARSTYGNYDWLYIHFCGLLEEYEFRFRKVHNYRDECMHEILVNAPKDLKGEQEPFVQCMPAEFMSIHDPVQAYRKYYRHKSRSMEMKWTQRAVPLFMGVMK